MWNFPVLCIGKRFTDTFRKYFLFVIIQLPEKRNNFRNSNATIKIISGLGLQSETLKYGLISLRLQNETLRNLIIDRNTTESGMQVE